MHSKFGVMAPFDIWNMFQQTHFNCHRTNFPNVSRFLYRFPWWWNGTVNVSWHPTSHELHLLIFLDHIVAKTILNVNSYSKFPNLYPSIAQKISWQALTLFMHLIKCALTCADFCETSQKGKISPDNTESTENNL